MAQKPRPIPSIDLVLHPEQDTSYQHFAGAAQHPFNAAARKVGRRNAWWMADAALLSYWDAAEALPRFAAARLDASPFNEEGVDGYIARGPDYAIVTFRGTEADQQSDVFDDANFIMSDWDGSGALVHQGFRDALTRVWPKVLPQIRSLAPTHSIWFTGHSLGAALATLAASRFPDTAGVCTVGSPRVGNHEFASAFSRRFEERAKRYVADTDVVTHVPPPTPIPYKHVDQLRQIDRNGAVGNERPSFSHFFNALIDDAQHVRQVMTALRSGAITAAPKFLLDHMPSGYAVDIWNDYDANGD